ncbi:MAG: hypothetical protein ACJ78Q_02320 [Chloroflexia bacterium]
MKSLAGVVVLVALLVAGCDSGDPATPTAVPAQTPEAPATVAPTVGATAGIPLTPSEGSPTPGTGVDLPGIVYDVSGGFAGMHDVLEISPSGEAKLSSKDKLVATRQLNQAQLDKLSQLLAAANFNGLKGKYDNGNVSDDIYQRIEVTPTDGGQGKAVVVAAEGGKGITPPALTDLIGELQGIMASMRPAPAKPSVNPAPAIR